MVIYTPIMLDSDEITRFIAEKGVKWSFQIIEGPGAGRAMTGKMILDYVADKVRLDVSCRDLDEEEVHQLLQILKRRVFHVSYKDPQIGLCTKEMYTNNYSATLETYYDNGGEDWSGLTFPLIEL